MDQSKIAILTTVANFNLYKKTSVLFPEQCQKYIIDGSNGMHGIDSILYMMSKLKGKDIQWLIMADEDVIFSNANLVFDIIEEMKAKNITVCGVRDGGLVSHRNQNPYLINTFFSILNFKEIESIWSKKEVLKNQFSIENEFQDDLSGLLFSYDKKSLFEPYYCFYLWLRRKGKLFLFLDATMQQDGISNKVFFKNKEIFCHTWYARSYGKNEKHTNRINKILVEKVNNTNALNNLNDIILFKKTTFALEQIILKYYKKVLRKLGK